MKKGILLSVFAAVASIILYSYPNGAANADGRDGTGAEGSMGGCGSCHTSATTDATKVELDSAGISVSSYRPGIAYTVKISASNGGTGTYPEFGFQLAGVLTTGAGTTSATNAGTWGTTLPSDVQNTTPATSTLNINIIEHSNPIARTTGTGSNGSTYVESIPWTAPASGTGSVLFYGIINEVDNNENPSAYQAATKITITEAVVVAPVASVRIAETSGSTTICQGSSVTFTATPTNGGTAPTYQWKVNGTAVNGATSSTFTSTTLAAGSDVVTCVMTSNLSGVTGSPATSTGITITVNASVTPSVSIVSTATSICTGGNVTFTATPTNGGAAPTYQWYNGSTAISGATASTYSTTTLTGSPSITVKLTSNATCPTTATVTSNAIVVTVGSSVTASVSIVSTATSICAGQNVTFTATPTNGGAAPAYQWYNGSTLITGATSSTYSSSALTGTASITVQLTSNAGCVATPTVTSNAIVVTAGSSVTPTISIVSSAGSGLCSGQSTTFTATPTNGGAAPGYQWYKNSGVIGGATSSTYSSSTFANNDIITCGLTSNAICASPTTATSNAITITITTNGVPSLSIVSNAGNTICSGQSVTFTASPTNGGSAPTYQWYNGVTSITGATSSTYSTNSITGNATISCQMVSNSQCVTTTHATSNSLSITVSGAVAPSVTIASNTGSNICSGQTVTFTASPVNGGPSPAYQWYNGSTAITGATSSTYSSSTLANGASVDVVLTSSSSCASPNTATSNVIIISVGTGVTASVSVSSSAGTSLCSAQTSTLTANPVNGGTSPIYQWLLNSTNITGATSSAYAPVTIANGDAYTVQMVSNASCVTQQTVSSTPLTFSVVAGGPAAVTVASNVGLNICQGVNVTFTATATNGGTSPTYQWTKNGSNVGNGTSTYMDNSLANNDVIVCSVSSSLSCASPATATSDNLTMTVYALPVAAITESNNVLSATQASSYQWLLNNATVTNDTNQTLVLQSNGNYTVQVTDAHGCQSVSAPFDVSTVGISEPLSLAGVTVYPNPAGNNLFVDFKGIDVDGKIIIRLLDMNGRVLSENIATPVGGEKVSLDMGQVQDGIYLLQINENDVNVYRKVVVSR